MTFKQRTVAALEEHVKGTNGVVKATILDCLTIVRQTPEKENNTFACTGENCPVKLSDLIGGQITKCSAHHCEHRTVPGRNDNV